MDWFDYSMVIPPLMGLLLAIRAALQDRRYGHTIRVGEVAKLGLIITGCLEMVWFAVVLLYSVIREPKRIDLWMYFVFIGTMATVAVKFIWPMVRPTRRYQR
jgi:hypothetical protein